MSSQRAHERAGRPWRVLTCQQHRSKLAGPTLRSERATLTASRGLCTAQSARHEAFQTQHLPTPPDCFLGFLIPDLQFQLTINLVAVATAVTGAIVAAESPLTAVQASPRLAG